jgi:SAM-dependent methyltransferase
MFCCPFCQKDALVLDAVGLDLPVLRDLQVIGGGLRKGRCPNCGSTDRDRLVFLYLRDILRLSEQPRALRILHIAPENLIRRYIRLLGFTSYVLGDLNPRDEEVIALDISATGFPDRSFDLILCNHVLEHIPEDRCAMTELFRLLCPTGIAILQVPLSGMHVATIESRVSLSPLERETRFGQCDHVRIYGFDYFDRLKQAGFDVEMVQVFSSAEEVELFGLNPREHVCVATPRGARR